MAMYWLTINFYFFIFLLEFLLLIFLIILQLVIFLKKNYCKFRKEKIFLIKVKKQKTSLIQETI